MRWDSDIEECVPSCFNESLVTKPGGIRVYYEKYVCVFFNY